MKITKAEEKTLSELRIYPFYCLLKILANIMSLNLEKKRVTLKWHKLNLNESKKRIPLHNRGIKY